MKFGVEGRERVLMRRAIAAVGIGVCLLAVLSLPVWAADDVVMRALRDELARSMKDLQIEKLGKPYFISYRVEDRKQLGTSATFGALLTGSLARSRFVVVQVRVGDYRRDNSNFLTYPVRANGLSETSSLPLDDDYQELRRQVWLATDSAYKAAVETLAKKRAALENRTTREDLPDFSHEEPSTVLEPAAPAKLDLARAEALVRSLSALFHQQSEVSVSNVSLELSDTHTWYLNSEGSATTSESTVASLVASAETQAEDGMTLRDWVSIAARLMDDFPKEAEIAMRIRTMAERLTRMRHAPLVDRYNGPVLFTGGAGAEIFSQVLAPKFLALRVPISDNPKFETYAAQNVSKFQDRLGARVLPSFLSVADDPAQTSYQGTPLGGGHAVDDEGVRSRPVKLVEKGILKTLLITRDPVSQIPQSTGSFRTFGAQPSNFIVSVEDGKSGAEMQAQLLSLIKQRDTGYGIMVRRVGREVYRIYPDGHQELVRQGLFDGLDDAAFKDLVAASRDLTVYTQPFAAVGGRIYPGQSGAPLVSFVAPSLLFEELTLKPAPGELPKLPLSKHPFFEK